MANRFRTVDRETPYLFPPSVQEWLPENLARRGGGGQAGVEEVGGFLHETGIGRIPSGMLAVLRVCDGGVFESEVASNATRFGGVSLPRRQHASGSRHHSPFPKAVFGRAEAAVCGDLAAGPGDGISEVGPSEFGWHEGQTASKHSALLGAPPEAGSACEKKWTS